MLEISPFRFASVEMTVSCYLERSIVIPSVVEESQIT